MIKLRTKPNHDGQSSINRCQNSWIVCNDPTAGIFISRISNVIAMAKTPSQNASSLACSLLSAMVGGLMKVNAFSLDVESLKKMSSFKKDNNVSSLSNAELLIINCQP